MLLYYLILIFKLLNIKNKNKFIKQNCLFDLFFVFILIYLILQYLISISRILCDI